ncbi:hypothetical protein JL100_015250 [Skermanella mucosa]|uniref:hypothetical protein n=1 Tax=Skermanella mucosa TaxID=1789672 RepID=UPI00192C20CE|nr:hypothetical protein [Skermanella mucosa]UEM18477.1 hypothetical protein JL100_015250 [Skermanella mucosa]
MLVDDLAQFLYRNRANPLLLLPIDDLVQLAVTTGGEAISKVSGARLIIQIGLDAR